MLVDPFSDLPNSVSYGRLLGILSTTPQFASARLALMAENLALRQQLLVLRRSVKSTSASSPRSLVLDRLVASVARLALHPRCR